MNRREPSEGPRCRKVLVTGALGFVAGHLLRELEAAGHEVYTTDALTPRPGTEPPPRFSVADLRDRDALLALVRDIRPDACVHLGAISFVPDGDKDPSLLLGVNIAGTVNLLEAFRRECPESRFLFVSSAQVYGPAPQVESANVPVRENAPTLPLSMYAISKVASERALAAYADAYGLQALVARPANHTGPGQTPRFVVPSFIRQVLEIEAGLRSEMRVGNLRAIRDFTDVRDVVRAYRLILEHGVSGQSYNVSSGTHLEIGRVLDRIQEMVGIRASIVVDPALVRPADASMHLDVTRLRHTCGWTPKFSFDQTLRDMIADARKTL